MKDVGSPTISVLIITLNEERLLEPVLDSVRWADEIIIVDSGSTDRTEDIARNFTEHFHVRRYTGEGDQRNHSLSLAAGEWIFYVDGDEIVSPELARSIRAAVVAPGGFAGFRMELRTRFLGREFGARGWRKEWKVRLFRRDRGHFKPALVHSGAVVDGPVGTLSGVVTHVPYRDIAHLIEKRNSYSTRAASDLAAKGQRSSALGAVFRGAAMFLRDFIIGGDFLYGNAGLVRSSISGYYTFLKYAKLWEHSLRPGRDDPH